MIFAKPCLVYRRANVFIVHHWVSFLYPRKKKDIWQNSKPNCAQNSSLSRAMLKNWKIAPSFSDVLVEKLNTILLPWILCLWFNIQAESRWSPSCLKSYITDKYQKSVLLYKKWTTKRSWDCINSKIVSYTGFLEIISNMF